MHRNLSAVLFAASLLFAIHASASLSTLMSFDTDRDGYVARAEFIAALHQRFDGMDSDRNGRLSKSELRGFAFKQMTAPSSDPLFGGSRPAKPPFEAKHAMDFETFSRDLMRLRFDSLDRDRDGRLSIAEVGK
jgi:Ca2+-binding EF-hand superfamily protein